MLPLVITVEQADGAVRRYAFADSPVSIGRSPFAELQLNEPFISRWEGTLRFDEHEMTYFGLGTTNSTYINGRALAANEEDIALALDSVLTLGELTLRFSREPVAEPDLRRKGKRRPTREGTDTGIKTVYLDAGQAWAMLAPAVEPELVPQPVAAVTPKVEALDTLRSHYREARAALLLEVCTRLAATPEAQRGAWLRELVQLEPGLSSDPELQGELQRAGLPLTHGELPELREWLRAIQSDLLPDDVTFDSRQTLTRVLGLVEALVQSLAEIHDAQETVRKRWLGRSARRSLLQSDKGNIVLAYLLNPQADWNERLRELEQSVRDVVTHELALFRATLEGARCLVHALSPEEITHADGSDDPRVRSGWWTRWFDPHAREHAFWQRFVKMYAELADGARYERIFLGRMFARSYLAAMGKPAP